MSYKEQKVQKFHFLTSPYSSERWCVGFTALHAVTEWLSLTVLFVRFYPPVVEDVTFSQSFMQSCHLWQWPPLGVKLSPVLNPGSANQIGLDQDLFMYKQDIFELRGYVQLNVVLNLSYMAKKVVQ